MTITEATAVNVVLYYMLGQHSALGALAPKCDVDIESHGAHLADKAHKTLNAGLDGKQFRRLWKGAPRRRNS